MYSYKEFFFSLQKLKNNDLAILKVILNWLYNLRVNYSERRNISLIKSPLGHNFAITQVFSIYYIYCKLKLNLGFKFFFNVLILYLKRGF